MAHKVKFYIGNVRQREAVDFAMDGVDYVFSAAPLKQVPSCEFFLKEGEFGVRWIPAIVIGICDPVTSTGGEYIGSDVTNSSGNGFFNRNFFVLSKHFFTQWGVIGTHIGYRIKITLTVYTLSVN